MYVNRDIRPIINLMRIGICLVIAAVQGLSGQPLNAEDPTDAAKELGGLRVGLAETDITPPVGFPMAGYYHERSGRRDHRPA